MTEVSTTRLYIMRATYLFITAGQVVFFWPKMISHSREWALQNGTTSALLVGMSVLMALGLRYPLKMLPILLFEFVWKAIWLVGIYYPLWRAGQVDAATSDSLLAVGMGIVICPIAIPWGYVIRNFIRQPGDTWRSQASDSAAAG